MDKLKLFVSDKGINIQVMPASGTVGSIAVHW